MSTLTDRITEVLEEHWLHHDNRCRCDKSRMVLTGAEWRAHVAEQIAEALQLKQETRSKSAGNVSGFWPEHRWMSAWSGETP